mmetsp:Transcript_41417/g.129259  ORF Transcript_41417/g.129259 Transcript_41417/m.129259 type:complete len:200 (+) Transcript_41417:247-846(+)
MRGSEARGGSRSPGRRPTQPAPAGDAEALQADHQVSDGLRPRGCRPGLRGLAEDGPALRRCQALRLGGSEAIPVAQLRAQGVERQPQPASGRRTRCTRQDQPRGDRPDPWRDLCRARPLRRPFPDAAVSAVGGLPSLHPPRLVAHGLPPHCNAAGSGCGHAAGARQPSLPPPLPVRVLVAAKWGPLRRELARSRAERRH